MLEVSDTTITQVTKTEVIRSLSKAWETVPEWRLGQLLYFLATIDEGSDIYQLSDEFIVRGCQSLTRENDLENVIPMHLPRTRDAYLQQCKKTLEESDYLDILCGIHEVDFYAAMEGDLKSIVDTYFSYTR